MNSKTDKLYKRVAVLTEANEKLKEENERLKLALDKIYRPVHYMLKEAEKEGLSFNGITAVSLSESHNYLKGIAFKALNP
jgi:hypothetical protein